MAWFHWTAILVATAVFALLIALRVRAIRRSGQAPSFPALVAQVALLAILSLFVGFVVLGVEGAWILGDGYRIR